MARAKKAKNSRINEDKESKNLNRKRKNPKKWSLSRTK